MKTTVNTNNRKSVSNKVLGAWYIMMMTMSLTIAHGAQAADSPYKAALKQCKTEFKTCKKSEVQKKVCRKEFRKCKDDNDVQFKDRLRRFKEKLSAAIEIEIKKDAELGEYMHLNVLSKALKKVPTFKQAISGMDSFVAVEQRDETKVFNLTIYNNDLGTHAGEKLQITEGRQFPKFINGQKYDDLFGKKFKVGNIENFQAYYDVDHNVAGAFMPAKVAGSLINVLNTAKDATINWIKGYLGLGALPVGIEDINSIPVNLKVEGQKVGRISILSEDKNGKNSGVVILVDLEKARELSQN